jgi:hypothetical protein
MLNNYIFETVQKIRLIKLVYYQISLCKDACKETVFLKNDLHVGLINVGMFVEQF